MSSPPFPWSNRSLAGTAIGSKAEIDEVVVEAIGFALDSLCAAKSWFALASVRAMDKSAFVVVSWGPKAPEAASGKVMAWKREEPNVALGLTGALMEDGRSEA